MNILRMINFEVPVYQKKGWPRYVSRESFRLPIWYLAVCVYTVVHILTTSYDTISTKDHLHIGILVFVWVVYTVFLVIRSVWNLATIQSEAREYEYEACESCCADMRGAEDGGECSGCPPPAPGPPRRRYCDWALGHAKRARSHKEVETTQIQGDDSE